jgi:hypothetical protein
MNDQLRNEYIAVIMSAELLKFCKDNELPFISADELALRQDLTDFQFGWLISYTRIWDSLIDAVDTPSTN